MNNKISGENSHWKNNFNYDYMGAYSLDSDQDLTVKIKSAGIEPVKNNKGKDEDCFVCYFENADKPMILNKTNCKIIEKVLKTPHVNEWIGKSIIIYVQTGIKAFGDIVDALRVRPFLPAVEKDYTETIKAIESCESLEALKAVYTLLEKTDQGAFEVLKAKDKRKAELS